MHYTEETAKEMGTDTGRLADLEWERTFLLSAIFSKKKSCKLRAKRKQGILMVRKEKRCKVSSKGRKVS